MNQKLADIFDIEVNSTPTTSIPRGGMTLVEKNAPSTNEAKSTDSSIDDDVEFARANLKNLIAKGFGTLDGLIDLAQDAEKASVYDSLSGMLANLANMNGQLLDIHAKKKAVTGKVAETNQASTTNNTAIFVGTTEELNDMIAKRIGG